MNIWFKDSEELDILSQSPQLYVLTLGFFFSFRLFCIPGTK